MIKLVVAEYCRNCPGFNPTCETIVNEAGVYDHYISCINSTECRHIHRYVESQLIKKERFGEAIQAINDSNKKIKENNNAGN